MAAPVNRNDSSPTQAEGGMPPASSRPSRVARERIGALREFHSVGRWSGRELTDGFRGPILQRSKPAGTSSAKYGDAHDYFGPPGLPIGWCTVPRRAGADARILTGNRGG